MISKKANYLPLIFLPIIIILCFGFWSYSTVETLPKIDIDSTTGVFDMRDVDFSTTIAQPSRTVEYVIGELLTPEEFVQRDDIQVGRVPDDTKICTH